MNHFLLFSAFVVCSVAVPANIVFIVADDLGYNDLSSTNGGLTFTPNIDALRAEGLVLLRQ